MPCSCFAHALLIPCPALIVPSAHAAAEPSSKFWETLLADRFADQREAEEAMLGRGMRERAKVG